MHPHRLFRVRLVDGQEWGGAWKHIPSDGIDWIESGDVRVSGHGLYFYQSPVLGGGTVGDAYGAGVECVNLKTSERYWLEALPDLKHWQIKLGAWRPGTVSEYVQVKRQAGDTWNRWYMCCEFCGAVCTFPGKPGQVVTCGWCKTKQVPVDYAR